MNLRWNHRENMRQCCRTHHSAMRPFSGGRKNWTVCNTCNIINIVFGHIISFNYHDMSMKSKITHLITSIIMSVYFFWTKTHKYNNCHIHISNLYRNHLRDFTLKNRIDYSKQHLMFVKHTTYISIFKISIRALYKNTYWSLQHKDIQESILNTYYSAST